MPHRQASPAASENGVDISASLFQDEDVLDSPSALAGAPTFDDNLDINGASDDGDDDEAFIAAQQAASNRKSTALKGKTVKKGGGFQAMGLNSVLLKAITRKGFSVPTPIQRKTIPLVLDNQDVVGMARTGSGKTGAFVIPMVEKLKAHSVTVGARAIILSPTRELALQTLKVVKEFGRGTDLRSVLLVGGDSLEEQFGSMASNPDIIIATPGRFLHLKVEMGLDLSSVRYLVFDEADRLFEMGFAAQLTELLHALPTSRQTLLFSATLPKSLVEFARAGLQEPTLVRLDADSKVSPDLESAFFTIKSAEKEGALLHLLQDVIKMPQGETEAALRAKQPSSGANKKRKRGADAPSATESPTPHSTIIFTATKHHVEYLQSLLRASGYAVSYVYGSLDQTARKMQVQDFRTGMTNILVVTDVAARGIDIPILANVINYDFPSQPKIFVHRVGRTARAGKRGWSYSLVRDSDMPYLLDLQLFLSRKLIMGRNEKDKANYAQDIVVGSLSRDRMERSCEEFNKLLEEDDDLVNLRNVAGKGEKLYLRTRNSASVESAKRAKEVLATPAASELHLLFDDQVNDMEAAREKMLAIVSGFRPQETIFEIGKRGQTSEAAEVMRQRRRKIAPRNQKGDEEDQVDEAEQADEIDTFSEDDEELRELENVEEPASEDELEVTFHNAQKSKKDKDHWQDSEHFMSYTPKSINMAEDKAYGVHSGGQGNFVEAARGATMDLTNDESRSFAEPAKARGMRWDKKGKKYVARANDEDGSKGAKMIKGESGVKIAASFRSGNFDAWRKANKVDKLPRVGELERPGSHGSQAFGRRFKHKAEKAPKEADKFRDDYYKRKKKVAEAKEKRIGKFREGAGKNELRDIDAMRKGRLLKEKRKEKNARPSKKRRV